MPSARGVAHEGEFLIYGYLDLLIDLEPSLFHFVQYISEGFLNTRCHDGSRSSSIHSAKILVSRSIRCLGLETLGIEPVAIFVEKDDLAERFAALPTNDLLRWVSEA